MITQHFSSWTELESHVQGLAKGLDDAKAARGILSPTLYRGLKKADWALDTTLERWAPVTDHLVKPVTRLADYYKVIATAKAQIETFTSRTWADIDVAAIEKYLSGHDAVFLDLIYSQLPVYDYLIYLRHHGFPSPLLDWSRSLYIAAFFAFREPVGERIAIFVYQEHGGNAGDVKITDAAFPQIHVLGPYVRTHPRHFLQQAEYTMCVRFQDGNWHLTNHHDVFNKGEEHQDRLWKFTVPKSEARRVMQRFDEFNINAFSLFQTEDSLLATLANRLLPAR